MRIDGIFIVCIRIFPYVLINLAFGENLILMR